MMIMVVFLRRIVIKFYYLRTAHVPLVLTFSTTAENSFFVTLQSSILFKNAQFCKL